MPDPTRSQPQHLRVEHRPDGLGVGSRTPRLSWQLPPDCEPQLAYELRRAGGCAPVRVESADSVLRHWPWPALRGRERHEVSVRVWSAHGPSAWSAPVVIEAGLDAAQWQSRWVRPLERGAGEPGFRPAYRLRGEAAIEQPVVRARLYVTAHGLHVTTLNGKPVTDELLNPGYTEYRDRLQVRTYDVTPLVNEGLNCLGALIADGWYRGSVGMPRSTDQFGERTAYLAQLEVEHPDGALTISGTDGSWRCSPSHILAADLIEGQSEDRRLLERGWDAAGFDIEGWDEVEVVDDDEEIGTNLLVDPVAPPVRAVREIRPLRVTELSPGRHLVDLGENINGWVRLRSLGPAGTRLRLVHAEWLGPDGDVTTEHLRPQDIPFITHEVRAGMVDHVVSAGIDGDVFEPIFTTHGFRYVRVEGHPGPLHAEDVGGIVVNTDLRERGGFSCSAPELTELYAAAVRSFRGNACDIPTDCPTRERAGWTGDWQVYSPVATFHDDVAGFSEKWLRDLAAAQWDNGIVGNMAPMPPAERQGFLEGLNGSAGWGDAIVLVPWEMYLEYGDSALLRDLWPHMEHWVAFALNAARDGRHPTRSECRPQAAAHESHLWDTGFHWGEWLVPGENPAEVFSRPDLSHVATAFLAHTTRTMSQIARVLGRTPDAARYADIADQVRAAWRAEFVGTDGRVSPRTQPNLVRALAFGLVPEAHRQRAADDLAELVRENGSHLATGFLSTRDLLPVLADHEHLDLAYDLLWQDTSPSWLAMLRRGATTMWERWEGVDEHGIPHESLNHYSKGAVIGFLHGHVAGLRRLEPTWRLVQFAPRPGRGVSWARAHHESPHGRIEAAWALEGETLRARLTVPPGCRAQISLPDGTETVVGPGTHGWGEHGRGEHGRGEHGWGDHG